MGRPTLYDEAIAEAICDRLAQDEGLSSICRDEGMPSTTTVYRWCDANPAFRANYARARVDQGHTVADQMGDIRRKLLDGEIDAPTATAMANMIKWEAGKRAPKSYGDKLALVGGDRGDAPIRHEYSLMTDEELDSRIAAVASGDLEPGADA